MLGVQTAEVNYVNAEKNWRVAFVALGALLAMPTDNIWETIELVHPESEHEIIESIPELLAFAREHRPDLKSAENTIQIARDTIDAALPALDPPTLEQCIAQLRQSHDLPATAARPGK